VQRTESFAGEWGVPTNISLFLAAAGGERTIAGVTPKKIFEVYYDYLV
jgi:hypothetical protein